MLHVFLLWASNLYFMYLCLYLQKVGKALATPKTPSASWAAKGNRWMDREMNGCDTSLQSKRCGLFFNSSRNYPVFSSQSKHILLSSLVENFQIHYPDNIDPFMCHMSPCAAVPAECSFCVTAKSCCESSPPSLLSASQSYNCICATAILHCCSPDDSYTSQLQLL